MNRFVLDASVALAWVVDKNLDPYAKFVQQSVQSGSRAVVPMLWQLEVTSVLAMVERRGTLTALEVEEGLQFFEGFLATRAETIAEPPRMRALLRVARELRLTSYDALYIDLARREGVPLATLDKNLRAAATKAGVKLL
jgi:predicted nucleic acid-binding protein